MQYRKKQCGYKDQQISAGKKVTVERKNDITINKFNGNLGFEYISEEN